MRGSFRLTGGVGVGLVLALAVSLVAGPKPTYVWTATLSSVVDDGGITNIFGPDGHTFTPADGAVSVSYTAPTSSNPGGWSRLALKVADGSLGWLGFRGWMPAQNGLYTGRSQVCHFSSTFDENGFPLWEGPYGLLLPADIVNNPDDGTSCIVDFLSGHVAGDGHKFPTSRWTPVTIDFRANSLDVLSIPVGATTSPTSSSLIVSIYQPAGCPTTVDETYYSMVGLGGSTDYGPFSVTRVDNDTWVVDAYISTKVYEYVPQPAITVRNKRTTTTQCPTAELTQWTITEPLRSVITWKRQLQSR